MATESIIVIATITGVFIAFIHLRLNYIDKQLDTLLPNFKSKQDDADKQLKKEISKAKPKKDSVLSFANQIASYTSIRISIKGLSKRNRTQVILDIISIVSIIAIAVVSLDPNQLRDILLALILIAIIAGFFSGLTFFDNLFRVNHYKNNAMDLDN